MKVLRKIDCKENNSVIIVGIFMERDEGQVISKKELQRANSKKLLEEIIEGPFEIEHTQHGVPILSNRSENISISHSEKYYAVQKTVEGKAGVDIQVLGKNLYEGRSYFVNTSEEKIFEMSNKNLYILWAVKETVYKMMGGEVANYKEDITILSIGEQEVEVSFNSRRIICRYEINDDFILSYVARN